MLTFADQWSSLRSSLTHCAPTGFMIKHRPRRRPQRLPRSRYWYQLKSCNTTTILPHSTCPLNKSTESLANSATHMVIRVCMCNQTRCAALSAHVLQLKRKIIVQQILPVPTSSATACKLHAPAAAESTADTGGPQAAAACRLQPMSKQKSAIPNGVTS